MDKLLSILSENSNFTTSELALMMDEPEDYIVAQIKEYESKGVIKGYHALVNWEKVPNSYTEAIIDLKVTPKRETGFDKISERISLFPEVEQVYLMAGNKDLQLLVRGETMQDVASFVAKKLSPLDGIISAETHFILKKYKENGVVMEENDEDEDKRSLIL
ncbi:MAG: Lrp/AsnC family transcriptional regulator [Acutalibacteraceae bacterium]